MSNRLPGFGGVNSRLALESTQQMTGAGGLAEGHGVAIVRAGVAEIEMRGGGESPTAFLKPFGTRIRIAKGARQLSTAK